MKESSELTDEEFRKAAFDSKTYDFWRTPKDDIYSLTDGEEIPLRNEKMLKYKT